MIDDLITFENLKYYDKCLKEYLNMKIELSTKKSTHCPNCGAVITGGKCEYCGTDFEQSMIWGRCVE